MRRKLERLVAMLARIDRIADVAMTTNGSALARKARALRPPGSAGHGQPRRARRRDVRRDERRRFPGRARAGGDRRRRRGGARPVKINMVVKRGVNEDSIVAMAEQFRGGGHILRFIEYMDVGTPTAGGWTTSSRPRRSSR